MKPSRATSSRPYRPGLAPGLLALLLVLVSPLSAQDDGDDLLELFNLFISPLPIASPSASSPSPAPSIMPKTVCPLCGTSFPSSAKSPGVVWGMRLDLRTWGKGIVDPPELPVCPSCGFVVYSSSIGPTELGRLRLFVASEAYKKIPAGHYPYYYLAVLRESGVVPLKDGSYSIAHAYLQAAWQAEDYKDSARERLYLEKALSWMDKYAKEVKRGDYYYPTSRILPADLLRRLGRFPEAEGRLRPLESDPDFQAAYLKRIIAAELSLIKVQDSSPQASP